MTFGAFSYIAEKVLHVETVAMALKKQEDKADSVFEFVQILPVMKIAVSDNMESRPKEVKLSFCGPYGHGKHLIWHKD